MTDELGESVDWRRDRKAEQALRAASSLRRRMDALDPIARDDVLALLGMEPIRVRNLGHALRCNTKVGSPCDCTAKDAVVYRLRPHIGRNEAPS